jgi:hypothetical protein
MRPREPPSTSNAEPAWAAFDTTPAACWSLGIASESGPLRLRQPLRYSCYPAAPGRPERIGWPDTARLPWPAGGSSASALATLTPARRSLISSRLPFRPVPAAAVCPFGRSPLAGTGCSLRSVLVDAAAVLTVATAPHLGQAPAPPSNEYRQPQKQATLVIIRTPFESVASLTPVPHQPCGWTFATFSRCLPAAPVRSPGLLSGLGASLRRAAPSPPSDVLHMADPRRPE